MVECLIDQDQQVEFLDFFVTQINVFYVASKRQIRKPWIRKLAKIKLAGPKVLFDFVFNIDQFLMKSILFRISFKFLFWPQVAMRLKAR